MVKTITITDEAYNLIKSNKQEGESFSKLFSRRFEKKLKIKEISMYLEKLEIDNDRVKEWINTIHKNRKIMDKEMRLRQNAFTR